MRAFTLQPNSVHAVDFLVPQPWDWTPEETTEYLYSDGTAMQMVSYLPKQPNALKRANLYRASVVKRYMSRSGLLATLPTDNPEASLCEIQHAKDDLSDDGFAILVQYNGVYLSDGRLNSVWAELNELKVVVFLHTDVYQEGHMGRPACSWKWPLRPHERLLTCSTKSCSAATQTLPSSLLTEVVLSRCWKVG